MTPYLLNHRAIFMLKIILYCTLLLCSTISFAQNNRSLSTYRELEGRVEELERDYRKLEDRVEKLKEECRELEGRVEELGDRVYE